MIPHLIHVGFPKTGSTYLQRWFEQHPQIDYMKGAFAGIRDVWTLSEKVFDAESSIRCRVTSAEQLATPTIDHCSRDIDRDSRMLMASAQATVCTTLAELFPTAHVLIVTRGFREMLLSGHSELVRRGGAERLHAFLRSEPVCRMLAQVLAYDRFVALYRARFGDRVIVLPYELLRDDPAAFLHALESPLGLDPHAPAPERANVSLRPAELRWYPRFSETIRRLPVGGRARSALLRRHIRWIASGRMRFVAQALDRLRDANGRPADTIPSAILEQMRGKADALAREPHHRRYAADYLA